MRKQVKIQEKVGVRVDTLWRALAKDLKDVLPKIVPNLVKDASIIEGDGSLGTVYLLNFGPDVKPITYQKEKIARLDESQQLIALEVIEGGHLHHGFSYYKTTFQLTAIAEKETVIDATVEYETHERAEENDMPSKTASSTSAFIKRLEHYLAAE